MRTTTRALRWYRRWWHRWRHPVGVHPWRWRLVVLWILAFTATVAWSFHVQGRLISRGEQAHDALCALQTNLQLQILASERYLDDITHHRRVPIQGITRNDILAGIKRSQLTLAALHDLHCHDGRPVPPPHDSLPPPQKTTPGVTTTTTTGG